MSRIRNVLSRAASSIGTAGSAVGGAIGDVASAARDVYSARRQRKAAERAAIGAPSMLERILEKPEKIFTDFVEEFGKYSDYKSYGKKYGIIKLQKDCIDGIEQIIDKELIKSEEIVQYNKAQLFSAINQINELSQNNQNISTTDSNQEEGLTIKPITHEKKQELLNYVSDYRKLEDVKDYSLRKVNQALAQKHPIIMGTAWGAGTLAGLTILQLATPALIGGAIGLSKYYAAATVAKNSFKKSDKKLVKFATIVPSFVLATGATYGEITDVIKEFGPDIPSQVKDLGQYGKVIAYAIGAKIGWNSYAKTPHRTPDGNVTYTAKQRHMPDSVNTWSKKWLVKKPLWFASKVLLAGAALYLGAEFGGEALKPYMNDVGQWMQDTKDYIALGGLATYYPAKWTTKGVKRHNLKKKMMGR